MNDFSISDIRSKNHDCSHIFQLSPTPRSQSTGASTPSTTALRCQQFAFATGRINMPVRRSTSLARFMESRRFPCLPSWMESEWGEVEYDLHIDDTRSQCNGQWPTNPLSSRCRRLPRQRTTAYRNGRSGLQLPHWEVCIIVKDAPIQMLLPSCESC